MTRIEVHCSMCSKQGVIEKTSEDLDPGVSLRRLIENELHWIVQVNGLDVDMYCSKRCAS